MKYKPFTIVDEMVQAIQSPDGVTMLMKPTVRVGTEEFLADAVARLPGPGNWPHVVVIEIHDCPYPTRGSGRRERLLREANVPLVRHFAEDIYRPDAHEHQRRMLREAVAGGAGRVQLPVSAN